MASCTKCRLHEAPIVEVEADDLKSLSLQLWKCSKDDLNPIEANGYKKLINEFQYDQDKAGKFIGKSRAHITNCLRLLSYQTRYLNL